jgi:ABC-type lipoprotein release transport system permease subunit
LKYVLIIASTYNYYLLPDFIHLAGGYRQHHRLAGSLYRHEDSAQQFYYRISLGHQYFLLAGVLSLSVAVLTTAFLAVRAAVVNPVDSLRHE